MRSPGPARIGVALPLFLFAACTALDNGADLVPLGSAGKGGGSSVSDGGGASEPGSSAAAGKAVGGSSSGAGEAGAANAAAGAAGASAGETGCPDAGERTQTLLGEAGEVVLTADTSWTCEHEYRLQSNVIVAPGVTLSVEPGTTIASDFKVMLLVQRGGRLAAAGSKEQPITFTSSKPEGSRAPGDYRGVVLIGDGLSHSTTAPVHDTLSDARAHYGGGQDGNQVGSCGSLRYVRIEFAGGSLDDAALPAGALTLAGCGTNTVIDHVQVHRATDGVGLLGGTVGLRHVIVTNNLFGEAIEWAGGYAGTMQFIVAQSLAASAAIQGSNSVADPLTLPVSRPTIYNATLVGSEPLVTGQHFGFLLQHGSRAVFKNSIIQGFADAAFDLRVDNAVLANELGPGKAIDISHTLMYANDALYTVKAQPLSGMESMRTQDPSLTSAAYPSAAMPDATPSFAPQDSTVNTQVAPAPAGFDATAGYRGAVPQDGADWTLGWTRFPLN